MLPLLFSRVSIFDVLRRQQQALKTKTEQLDASVIESFSEQELVKGLATEFKLEMPVLEEDKVTISHREVNIDVSQDPMRMIWDRSRPFNIKGTEITFHIPFKGDPQMFYIRPSTHSLNPPLGEIHSQEIHLVYRRTDSNAAAVKTEYQNALKKIKQYLAWLEGSVSDFNSNVGAQAQALVSARKQKLAATSDMVAAIGLPVRPTDVQPVGNPLLRTKAIRKGLASAKKWDVFICHASEDKDDLVRPLAVALHDRGVSVWYDEFSLKLGDSLRASIDYGLANARYGIVIISERFFAKHWPVQELNGLSTREVAGKKVILPIWHHVTVEKVRENSPILADRVALPSEVGIERLVEAIVGALEED